MNKLLHERLRIIEKSGSILSCLKDLIGEKRCPDMSCQDCVRRAAKILADEIEKYYIPRPRFNDGEPVQGDRLFNSPIDYYYVYNDGSWVVYLVDDNGEDNGELSGHASDFVRLPEPDSLEKLRDDATKPSRQYYADHIGHDVGLKDDEEIYTAVHKHIIDRAVAIMGRDA